MGVLRAQPIAELALALRDRYNVATLVETGTFHGESTSWAAEHFRRVITIDISAEFQNGTRDGPCRPYDNITYLLGDTRDMLPPVVGSLPGPSLFWLDAHEARGLFGREEDDCPILEELDTVLSVDQGHCVLIDDAACFIPPVPHDPLVWPEISILEAVAKKHNYVTKVGHDVIAMVPLDTAHMLNEFGNSTHGPLNEITCQARIDPFKPGRRMFHINLIPPKITCRATATITPREDTVVVDLPFQITEILDTVYGRILVPKYDVNQTGALRQGYSLDHETIQTLATMLKDRPAGSVFLDIGANVGCFSWGLVPYCASVHMFEPQRIIYNMMCGTVALNGWHNIWCHNMAVSDELEQIEVPQFDYRTTCNFGSIEFGRKQKEKLHQERMYSSDKVEYVQAVPIDFFKYVRVDLMKIDVEGMEFKVLRGAKETIRRCRPIILIEFGKVHQGTLRRVLEEELNYDLLNNGNDYLCTPRS